MVCDLSGRGWGLSLYRCAEAILLLFNPSHVDRSAFLFFDACNNAAE